MAFGFDAIFYLLISPLDVTPETYTHTHRIPMQPDGSFVYIDTNDFLPYEDIRAAFPDDHSMSADEIACISGSSCSRHLSCKVVSSIFRATPKLPLIPDFIEVRQTRLSRDGVRYTFLGAFVNKDFRRGTILGVLSGKRIDSGACGEDGENSDMTLPFMKKTKHGWLHASKSSECFSIRCRPGATKRATWVHYINSAPMVDSARYTNCSFISAAKSARDTACLLVLDRDVTCGDELYTVYGDEYPLADGADGVYTEQTESHAI